MSVDLQRRISQIKTKSALLLERAARVEELKAKAEARVEELTAEVEAGRREIERLKLQLEYPTVARVSNPSREDVERSRALIFGLVREIDKCIADLND